MYISPGSPAVTCSQLLTFHRQNVITVLRKTTQDSMHIQLQEGTVVPCIYHITISMSLEVATVLDLHISSPAAASLTGHCGAREDDSCSPQTLLRGGEPRHERQGRKAGVRHTWTGKVYIQFCVISDLVCTLQALVHHTMYMCLLDS